MSPIPSVSFRRAAALAACAIALPAAGALGASTASAASGVCPKHTTEVGREGGSVYWTDHGTLWSCTTYGGRKPQNRPLGPWTTKSQLILGDGPAMAWTQRTKVSGKTADLVWAADISSPSKKPQFMRGLRPAIGPGSSTDLRVSALVALGRAVGWVTTQGAAMTAFAGGAEDPTAIGVGTAGASDIGASGQPAGGGGLLATPLQVGSRIMIGRWKGIAPSVLADSMTINALDGESDDCGGGQPYDVLVTPVEGATPVGVNVMVSWVTLAGPCA